MHEPPQSHIASQQARIHYDSSTQESQYLTGHSEIRTKPRSETTPPRTGAYRRFGRLPDTPAFEHLRTTSDTPISCSIQATPHHAGSRIGTDTPISESLRITAITPALGSEQSLRFSRLAERKPANRRHPIGIGHRPAEAPEDTRPGLPHRGTPGRRFPRHPATPRIRPPRSPPPKTTARRRPPEDDPEDALPCDKIRRRAATHEKKRAELHAGKPSLR